MEPVWRPSLAPNRKKIVESVLFLIEEAERRGGYVTKYDIVKSIFVADAQHLNTYGRPVTFDNYYAMKDGPVPSHTYELLTEPSEETTREIAGWPLWHREASPIDGTKAQKFVRPKRSANLRALSDTDVSALREALKLIKAQTFAETRDMTHEHRAYKEAWVESGDKRSYQMSYPLLSEYDDQTVVSDVVQASHYA